MKETDLPSSPSVHLPFTVNAIIIIIVSLMHVLKCEEPELKPKLKTSKIVMAGEPRTVKDSRKSTEAWMLTANYCCYFYSTLTKN